MKKGLIQVAGVIDQTEANMLLQASVDWLGFPLRLPVHTEDLSEAAAAEIIRCIPAPAAGVLITYLDRAGAVDRFCKELGAGIVQLHGEIPLAEVQQLKENAPDLFVMKSLVVRGDNLAELSDMAKTYAPFVDAFITDTHDPTTGADGATGKTHDWRISRELVTLSPKPVILAGGLNPGNVQAAIEEVRPAGVDVHTGVEDDSGRKCPKKVTAFVAAARKGFAAIGN